jgi:hypothetical protein
LVEETMSDAIRPPPTPATKPAMPAAKVTQAMEPPPAWAIALSQKMETGFERMDSRLEKVESNQEIQGDTVRILAKQVALHSDQLANLSGLQERHSSVSIRTKAISEDNLKQDAAIAMLHTKVDRIDTALAENTATTTDIKKAVSGVLKEHPQLVTGLVSLVMAAVSFATAWFSRGH